MAIKKSAAILPGALLQLKNHNEPLMSLIKSLFGISKVECPRCLGKGNVDLQDIKRLNKELFWVPGKCAYCNGKGKVPQKRIEKIPADFEYLTTDLSFFERYKIISGDKNALKKANQQTELIENFIEDIKQQHYKENKELIEIANYLTHKYNLPAHSEINRKEIIEFIEKVIKDKS